MVSKAQLKIGETIAVLIFFFFIVAIGLIFYARWQINSIQEKQYERVDIRSVITAQQASYLIELSCTLDNTEKAGLCIDVLKLHAFSALASSNYLYYFDTLGYANISVDEIYPQEIHYPLYEHPLNKSSDMITAYIPVSIYDPIEKNYSFGQLIVITYAR